VIDEYGVIINKGNTDKTPRKGCPRVTLSTTNFNVGSRGVDSEAPWLSSYLREGMACGDKYGSVFLIQL
jgi:hypothetical protein